MDHLHNIHFDGGTKIWGASKKSIEWLNYLSELYGIKIQHAANSGEYKIKGAKTIYRADGFCKDTNTWYEFFGDLFHLNPVKYKANDSNYFGIIAKDKWLYDYNRLEYIKSKGYNIEYIWENEWDQLKKLNKCSKC
jgi:hypothetical protein